MGTGGAPEGTAQVWGEGSRGSKEGLYLGAQLPFLRNDWLPVCPLEWSEAASLLRSDLIRLGLS